MAWACLDGSLRSVEELLDRGADINQRPQKTGGRTALMIACGNGKARVASYLIDRGAQVRLVDREGKDEFYWAVSAGSSSGRGNNHDVLAVLENNKRGVVPKLKTELGKLNTRPPCRWGCGYGIKGSASPSSVAVTDKQLHDHETQD